MASDTASRKWQITINNPLDKGFTHEKIIDLMQNFKSCLYYCLCDEIGLNENTPHTHLFMQFKNAVMFSKIKNLFNGGHFEMAKGTCLQNRDYIRKEGKWKKDEKTKTNLIDTFFEFGEMPLERQGARNDISDLYDMIKSGMSNFDIVDQYPQYMLQIEKLDNIRNIIRENNFKNTFRNVETTYINGTTGTGKTRSIMELYGYDKVHRITDYLHPWDNYKGQDVIIFEEFRSSLKVQDMLNYLDGYPLELPSRYFNKVACFTKIYIISNVPIENQYIDIQEKQKLTYNAFLRRIQNIQVFSVDNEIEYFKNDDSLFTNYFNRFVPVDIVQQVF